MKVERFSVSVTTAADGSATAYSPTITGAISSISYVKAASNSFDDGVDFTITAEQTGQTIWAENDVNASATRAPRQRMHTTAGLGLFTTGGNAEHVQVADICLAEDRVKIVIAQGGNAKNGTFIITVI